MAGNPGCTAQDLLDLPGLEAKALADIRAVVNAGHLVAVGYSGGKDSMVAMHLANRVHPGCFLPVCETSWYFGRALRSIERIAARLEIDVQYRNSLDLEWLRKHPEVLFSDASKVRSWTFSQRQQKTVKTFAAENKCTAQMFGRRTEENSVKAVQYDTSTGVQLHPVRDWREGHIWAYMRTHSLPVPWIYGTRFGAYEGNAPFYTMRARDHGGMAGCWNLAEQLDSRYTQRNLLHDQ